jgi:hypothetical protein
MTIQPAMAIRSVVRSGKIAIYAKIAASAGLCYHHLYRDELRCSQPLLLPGHHSLLSPVEHIRRVHTLIPDSKQH